jgi:undecaprenyl-diphosphatase
VNDRTRGTSLAAAALAIALASSTDRGRSLDARAFHRLNAGGSASADLVFGAFTELGSIWASAGAAAALAAAGRRREAAPALGAAGATWALGQACKRVFMRPRPYDAFGAEGSRLLIRKPRGTSWPSSHPAVLVSFLTVAARELGLGSAARAGMLALAGTVGASRIHLGVHFPSDVVGGLLLGRAVGLVWPSQWRSGR